MMLKKFLNSILHCYFITRNMEITPNNQVQAFCNTKKHYCDILVTHGIIHPPKINKELMLKEINSEKAKAILNCLKNDHLIEHNQFTMLLGCGLKANKYACTDDATASLSCD
ncbi:hypothetical protein T01_2703 [Trichinella spiralis]|uniref:Uncharacterized protein n=1 Tax=Trichinella spiralis TaxID=6334 RepID=A0A0V1BXY2_TRISP|nr:hypothetical protein T01_2703 [Trichinella spiralis]